MIKSGATDFPGDPNYGMPEYMPTRFEKKRQNSPMKPPTVHDRSASKVLTVAASPVEAGHAGKTKGNIKSNVLGNAAAYVQVEVGPLPDWYSQLNAGYKPTVQEVFRVLPVVEPCRIAASSSAGVIRIRNIPYNTQRAEVTAFMGRNAQVLPQPPGSPYFGTHLIMERLTGKVMDAFVECENPKEAAWVVSQFQGRVQNRRPPKLGDRVVDVEMSSQAILMSELFPCARKVTWEGNYPRVQQSNESYYTGIAAAGFTGFLQKEEIAMIVKFAETPYRVSLNSMSFSQLDC